MMERRGMIEWFPVPLRGKAGTSFATCVKKALKVASDERSALGRRFFKKRVSFASWVQAGVFALSLLLMPLAMSTSAQVQDTTPVPNVKNVESNYNRGYAGLWGLAGLLGLAGLAGRRRAPAPERSYTERETHGPVV